jgi:hypothetical protein
MLSSYQKLHTKVSVKEHEISCLFHCLYWIHDTENNTKRKAVLLSKTETLHPEITQTVLASELMVHICCMMNSVTVI